MATASNGGSEGDPQPALWDQHRRPRWALSLGITETSLRRRPEEAWLTTLVFTQIVRVAIVAQTTYSGVRARLQLEAGVLQSRDGGPPLPVRCPCCAPCGMGMDDGHPPEARGADADAGGGGEYTAS